MTSFTAGNKQVDVFPAKDADRPVILWRDCSPYMPSIGQTHFPVLPVYPAPFGSPESKNISFHTSQNEDPTASIFLSETRDQYGISTESGKSF